MVIDWFRGARGAVLITIGLFTIALAAFAACLYDLTFYRTVGLLWLQRPVCDAFHRLHYRKGLQFTTTWLGVPLYKIPEDLVVYQEIICQTKPDVIVECGTGAGGSTLFFASICELINNGRVISIDLERWEGRPEHRRIVYLTGSSVATEIVDKVRGSIRPGERVMAVLDSDHHKEHVLKELRAYAPMVSVGNYLVVEDTNINGHPVYESFGPGPMEAVEEFLRSDGRFQVDRGREKYLLTYFPKGYLRKTRF